MGTGTDGRPAESQVIEVPEITITGTPPPRPMDKRGVIVDGMVKPPNTAIDLSGHVTGIQKNEHTGLTTVSFEDQRHNKRAISFADPMGNDANGKPLRHPLGEMVDTIEQNNERDSMKIKIDGKGNTDFAVGNKEHLDRGHTGPDLPKDLAPNDPRMPTPDKKLLEEIGKTIKDDDLKSHMPVKLGVAEKENTVSVSGQLVGYSDRDGVKTVTFEKPDGKLQQLSFNDPVGQDHNGKPVHHPLSSLGEDFKRYQGANMRLDIDASGKNAVVAMAGPLATQPAMTATIGPESQEMEKQLSQTRKPVEKPQLPEGAEPVRKAPPGTTMESLLKPTGPNVAGSDGKFYVQLGHPVGSLRVQASMFEDFKKAEQYLGKSKEAVDVLYNLENPPKRDSGHWYAADKYPPPIEVRPGATVADDQFAWGKNKTPAITWAPNGGLRNADGQVQSPAMALLHETGHAVEWQQHEDRINKNARDYPVGSDNAKRWDTAEEKRNIEGLEHRVGRELGEPLRYDHHGSAALTRDPISREPGGPPPPPHPYVNPASGHVPETRLNPSVNGVEKPNGCSISGKIVAFEDRDGEKSVTVADARGKTQTLSFPDPAGFDPNGQPVRNPLGTLSNEFKKGTDLKLDIDPSGRNVVGTVGQDPVRLGPQADQFSQKLNPARDTQPGNHER